MPSKHIALIVHGARADRPDVRHLVNWVRDKGHHVEPHATFETGDASAFAADAAQRGVDVVAAAGGDGTVNEVVNGLDGFDVPLGIIPLGTANDFARQVGIPADADHAMDVILQRKPRRLDTASLNGRRFLNVSTGGIGAEATAETPAEVKESLGPVAYAISGIAQVRRVSTRSHARFTGDGVRVRGRISDVRASASRARPAAGRWSRRWRRRRTGCSTCVSSKACRARDFARLVLRVKRGEHLGHDGVHYVQLRSVTIEGDDALSVNVDGENSNSKSLDVPRAGRDLWVHVVRLPGEAE